PSYHQNVRKEVTQPRPSIKITPVTKNMIREEKMIDARVHSLLIVSAALSCGAQGASRQTAYSYPWCGTNSGGESCYYATLEQCMATTAGGRGGRCLQSPYYRRDAAAAPRSQ